MAVVHSIVVVPLKHKPVKARVLAPRQVHSPLRPTPEAVVWPSNTGIRVVSGRQGAL
jgi:hypothetical protein